MALEMKKEVVDLLRGKRVAIVGPSDHLAGKGIGYKIDAYDIVCRVNDIIDRQFTDHFVPGCEIVFHSCPSLWRECFAF